MSDVSPVALLMFVLCCVVSMRLIGADVLCLLISVVCVVTCE